jgi:hypothetical protein
MRTLVLKAYWKLIWIDRCLARGDFAALYATVRNYPIRTLRTAPDMADRLCLAMETACIWYWKRALCLQRSAALTCLLRDHGVRAEMVIGAQQLPFKAHAWVEVAGLVVNDKSYVPETYAVLDRC